jgi:uncharacterized RDD family membrane protein YckC
MQTDILDNLEEEHKLSPKRLRIAAALVDFLIIWCIGFILGIFFGTFYRNDYGSFGYHLNGFPALIQISFWFLLFPVAEGLTSQTIGKRIMGIQVIKANYSKTTILSSLVRHLFDIIDLFFLIGLIVASSNRKKQRIGDLVGNTLVVLKIR